jgi:hypothetical protein
MSTRSKKVINAWIRDFLPKEMAFGEVEKLARAAQISPGTIRQIRNRESMSAETIVSIMLARGVSEDDLINIPQRGEAKFSKSLSDWNHLGNSLSEKQREQIVKLANFLLADWKVK